MPPAEQLYRENQQLLAENAVLRQQLEWFKRRMFGPGSSEKTDRLQALLELEGGQAAAAPEPAATHTLTCQRRSQRREERVTRAEAFKHVPVAETVVIEPEEVKAQPEAFERIGEERTFEIDVVPPRIFKREIMRPKNRHKTERLRLGGAAGLDHRLEVSVSSAALCWERHKAAYAGSRTMPGSVGTAREQATFDPA
jgi:transposase